MQYGFRKSHSTSHAVRGVVTKLLSMIISMIINIPLYFCFDLKKAFDTVTHQILLSNLKHYGILGKAYDFLSSYLEERKQYCFEYQSCINY